MLQVDARFLPVLLRVPGRHGVLLTAFVGPGSGRAGPGEQRPALYFCRPFTRAEYVFGKMSLLLALLSAITWVPGLLLFLIQSSLAGAEWTRQNCLDRRTSIFAGLMIWDVTLCLIALALSAWIKWRIAAGGAILGSVLRRRGLRHSVNAIVRTNTDRCSTSAR